MGMIDIKKIAFDVDEVISPFAKPYWNWYNKKHNTKYDYSMMTSYNFWELCNESKDNAVEDVLLFCDSDEFKNIVPYKDAIDIIFELHNDGFDIQAITARFNKTYMQTRAMFDNYVPGCISKITHSNFVSKTVFGNDYLKTKKEVCDDENISIIVEDSLSNCKECAVDGRRAILFDTNWNKCSYLPKDIVRVYSHKEVLDTIREWTKSN